jgi:hypothetical protein
MVLKMRQRFSIGRATGQGLNEYGLILGLVVILAIPGLMLLGNQSKGGVDAVNDNADEMKDMVNVLNNQTPGGQSLVSRPSLPTPLIDIGGQALQFQLNRNTGLVEASVGNGGITEQIENATNTTSAEGLQKKLIVDIQKESQLLTELGLDGDLEKVLAGTNFFRNKMSHVQDETTGTSGTLAVLDGGANGGGGLPQTSRSVGVETNVQEDLRGLNVSPLATLLKNFDLSSPLFIKPADINLSSLHSSDQAWFGEFFMMQQSTLSIINNPILAKTKPELVDKLRLNLQMTFYNQFLPKLKSDPAILTSALVGNRVSSNR